MAGKSVLAVLVATYVAERVALGQLVPASAVRVRGILTGFAADAEHLDRDYVIAWRDSRRHVAPGTLRHEWGVVRAWCKWLTAQGHIDGDPCAGLPPPKVPRSVPRALTPQQIDLLWRALPDERARAIVALMAWMGLRLSEVCDLEVGDWDRWTQVLRVRGKGGHERLLPVPTRVRLALDTYLASSPATAGPLIRSLHDHRSPVGPCQVGRLVSMWMRSAGIKVAAADGNAPHALRHSFAQSVYAACGDLRTVQDALGHVSISSTAIYMRHASSVDRIRAAMESAA